MTSDQLIDKLNAIEFFSGFADEVKIEYVAFIADKFDQQIAGPNQAHFERYPGLALVVESLLMKTDWFETDLENLAEASFGLFDAQEIQIVGDDENPILEFTLDDQPFRFENSPTDIVWGGFEFVAKTIAKNNGGVRPHGIVHPAEIEAFPIVFCSNKTLERLQDESLIPDEYETMRDEGLPPWDGQRDP